MNETSISQYIIVDGDKIVDIYVCHIKIYVSALSYFLQTTLIKLNKYSSIFAFVINSSLNEIEIEWFSTVWSSS